MVKYSINIFLYFLFAFLFCFSSLNSKLFSQQVVNDANLWLSLAIKQKISKNVSYRVMARGRDGENFSRINSYYVDGGLAYNFTKNFNVSLDLVYAPSRKKDLIFRTFYQYYISINNKLPLNRYLYFSNRIIFQNTSHCFIIDNGTEPYSRTDLRERLLFNVLLGRRIKFYIGDEIMTTLFTSVTELRRNRFYVGLTHKLNKQVNVDYYFILQSALNRKMDTNDYVYGITLTYKLRSLYK